MAIILDYGMSIVGRAGPSIDHLAPRAHAGQGVRAATVRASHRHSRTLSLKVQRAC